MILIFGGAYQGKLEYAKEHYDINTVYDCSVEDGEMSLAGREPDFSADAIYNMDRFVLKCVREGKEAADFFKENRERWHCGSEDSPSREKIFILNDVSQGIVPMDATLRAFREMNGRLMLYLSKEANQVIRVFCGMGKKVK